MNTQIIISIKSEGAAPPPSRAFCGDPFYPQLHDYALKGGFDGYRSVD